MLNKKHTSQTLRIIFLFSLSSSSSFTWKGESSRRDDSIYFSYFSFYVSNSIFMRMLWHVMTFYSVKLNSSDSLKNVKSSSKKFLFDLKICWKFNFRKNFVQIKNQQKLKYFLIQHLTFSYLFRMGLSGQGEFKTCILNFHFLKNKFLFYLSTN
jgi:hypothetical protein